MSYRSTLIGIFSAVGLACLGACFIAPGELKSTVLSCTAAQRAFNGECRTVCTDPGQCDSTEPVCASVDQNTAVCVEAGTTCSYLGSDTECLGTGGYYEESGRGTYEVWIQYGSYPDYPYMIDPSSLTSNTDPYFTPYGYQPNVQSDSFGCQGNAVWVSIPAVGGVSCRGTHEVSRCRLSYNDFGQQDCALIDGSTPETVLPTQ